MNIVGNVAFVSVKTVCLVKCVFKISAFNRSENKFYRRVKVEVCSGFINCLSVLHQSFCPMLVSSNLVAKLFTSSDLDLRISLVTLFLTCLYMYLSKSLILFVCLYLPYKRFFFRSNRLMLLLNHDGSDCLTFIILFGTCLLVSSRTVYIYVELLA